MSNTLCTLGSELSSAALCTGNGWEVGTVLSAPVGRADHTTKFLCAKISAIGKEKVLALDAHSREFVLDLSTNNWTEVPKVEKEGA